MDCVCDFKDGLNLLDGGRQVPIAEDGYVGLYMEKHNIDNKYRLIAYGEDTCEVDIYYCPFCGRKLI